MTPLATLPAWLAAAVVLLAVVSIGVLIWSALPRQRRTRRNADIERQIKTLRQGADHAVATRPRVHTTGQIPPFRPAPPQQRPRVRANGCAGMPGHIKAAPRAEKPKACGGGLCRHRADCSDHYCPGRLSASLTGTEARHASH